MGEWLGMLWRCSCPPLGQAEYQRPSQRPLVVDPSRWQSAVGRDDLAVQLKQCWDLVTLGPRHSAFGADPPLSVAEVPVDEADLLRGGSLCLVLRVVRHEGEVELGRRLDVE